MRPGEVWQDIRETKIHCHITVTFDFHQQKLTSLLIAYDIKQDSGVYSVFCGQASKKPWASMHKYGMCQTPYHLITMSAFGSCSYKLTKLQNSSIETIQLRFSKLKDRLGVSVNLSIARHKIIEIDFSRQPFFLNCGHLDFEHFF